MLHIICPFEDNELMWRREIRSGNGRLLSRQYWWPALISIATARRNKKHFNDYWEMIYILVCEACSLWLNNHPYLVLVFLCCPLLTLQGFYFLFLFLFPILLAIFCCCICSIYKDVYIPISVLVILIVAMLISNCLLFAFREAYIDFCAHDTWSVMHLIWRMLRSRSVVLQIKERD